MGEKEALIQITAKVPPEKAARIDARREELGLADRATYVRHVIDRDLIAASGTPLFKEDEEGGERPAASPPVADALTPEIVKRLLDDALAPAVYVVLSAVKRVSSSEQAAAVVNQVLLSGAARRELESFPAPGPNEGVES